MKIQFKDAMSADRRHLEDLLVRNGHFATSSVPSLSTLQNQFASRKQSNQERLTQLLRESHPELKETEIKELMRKYQ